jgi:tRNA nucleotidyltransferase (CCA-adding enzyme)
MLGAVCHDLGNQPRPRSDGRIRSIDHEQAGVAPAPHARPAECARLAGSTSGPRSRASSPITSPLAFFKSATPVSDGAFRRLAQKVDLELLARVAESDCLGRTGGFDCSGIGGFLERARALGVEHAPPPPIVKGRHLIDLDVTPGPAMGVLLREIYEHQLDGRIQNLDDGLALARALLERGAERRP